MSDLDIIGKPANKRELEDKWEEYCDKSSTYKKLMDDKSIQTYGLSVEDRYKYLKDKINERQELANSIVKEEVEQNINYTQIKYPIDAIDKAKKWGIEAIRTIVYPINDEQKLDDLWYNFNSMIRKNQRESDWKSMELFGVDNKTHYEFLKSKFLKKDIPDEDIHNIDKSINETDTSSIETIKYPSENIDKAKKWGIDSIRSIIVPNNNEDILDKYWHGFKSMTRKQQRESDWKSMELFGVDNKTHYEFLKSKFLKKDIPDELDSVADTVDASTVGEDEVDNPDSLFEAQIDKNTYVMDDSIEYFKDNISDITSVPDECLPYYDPDELEYLQPDDSYVGDGEIEDPDVFNREFSIREWQKAYKEGREYNTKLWEKQVYLISHKLEASRIANNINTLKLENTLLSLGWNPSIPFNEKTKMIGSIRLLNKNQSEIIDVTESYLVGLEESKKVNSLLEPIYIVLIQGHSLFSTAIKITTKGPFSHAAITLDDSMENLFSYNIGNDAFGLSLEGISKYGKDTIIGIYCIFVKPNDKNQIKKVIDEFLNNKEKTSYSIANVFTFLAGIPLEKQYSKICSQFVDTVLKLSNIDITNKASSLVSPNDFMNKAINNNKIYKMFEGKCSDFKQGELKYKIKKLKKTAQVIKEVKDLPVRFDDSGNLLIKNMKKLDFEHEYSACHKLLLSYEKTKNYEGIKYELSKLWFMNHLIEKKIHDKNTSEANKQELRKARARILNDFYKYMDIIQKNDQDFNFNQYYEDSPFSDVAYKVNPSTLKFTIKTIKDLVF